MRLVWPPKDARVLSDQELEELYTYPAARWLAVNAVSSADGAMEVDGRSGGLSNEPDRRVLRLGSDLADVLLVGARTAMVEEFRGIHPDDQTAERRRRHGLAPVAPTAVVTRGQTLPPDAPVITDALVPTIVITTSSVPETTRQAWMAAGAQVMLAGTETVDLPRAIDSLADRGLGRIDCEGGPRLLGSLLAAGLVDELRLTLSPMLVAGRAGRIATGVDIDPATLELASTIIEDDTVLTRYRTQH
jgi:riboflavin biosynthesis pyrimidine reductase